MSRYALYTRDKWRKDHDPCFAFSSSFATLKEAVEKLEWCKKHTPSIEVIVIESMNAHHRIDPYHIHFAKTDAA